MKVSVPESPAESSLSSPVSYYSPIYPHRPLSSSAMEIAETSRIDCPKRSNNNWPAWTGTTNTFDFFMLRVKTKAREEERQGVSLDMFLNMAEAVPDSKKQRLSPWFNSRAKDDNYEWKSLYNYIQNCFGEKKSIQAAAELLSKLRQGKHQFFNDFMKDFDHQLALAEGEEWPSNSKLSHLSGAINRSLRGALVFVDLPLDYDDWVAKVSSTAKKLENLGDYRPPDSRETVTWISTDATIVAPISSLKQPTTNYDGDGDVIMEDASLSVLSAELRRTGNRLDNLESGEGNQNREARKPPAPWRPKNEFLQLLENGLCTRCAKPGHQSRKCPSFSGPRRRGNGVSTALVLPDEVSGNERP